MRSKTNALWVKKILLLWWWTGGHIMPLLAIYNSLKDDKNLEFFWVGESGSLEENIAWKNEIKFYAIKSGKLRRYFSFRTFVEPFHILIWIIQSIIILYKLKPDLIFSKWWYVSLPMAIAGKIFWIKLFLHESDSVPGLANRIVARFASKIFLGFESAKVYFKNMEVEVIGQILNPELFENYKEKYNLIDFSTSSKWQKGQKLQNVGNDCHRSERQIRTNLLVIAWSQWSTRIFDFLLRNIDKLKNFKIDIILGSQNMTFREKFEKYSFVNVYDFVDQNILKNLYYTSDLAITRAGATTLAEIEAFNIRMIIIPLTESANNHQYYNALEYEKKWNVLINENELNNSWIDKILTFDWYKKQLLDFKNTNSLEIIKKTILK